MESFVCICFFSYFRKYSKMLKKQAPKNIVSVFSMCVMANNKKKSTTFYLSLSFLFFLAWVSHFDIFHEMPKKIIIITMPICEVFKQMSICRRSMEIASKINSECYELWRLWQRKKSTTARIFHEKCLFVDFANSNLLLQSHIVCTGMHIYNVGKGANWTKCIYAFVLFACK